MWPHGVQCWTEGQISSLSEEESLGLQTPSRQQDSTGNLPEVEVIFQRLNALQIFPSSKLFLSKVRSRKINPQFNLSNFTLWSLGRYCATRNAEKISLHYFLIILFWGKIPKMCETSRKNTTGKLSWHIVWHHRRQGQNPTGKLSRDVFCRMLHVFLIKTAIMPSGWRGGLP